jgi:general secretion pathway protein C
MEIRAIVERYLWILNLVLIFLLCYFVAGVVNAYLSSRYLPAREGSSPASGLAEPAIQTGYQWKDQAIIDRNVFGVKTGWEDEFSVLEGEGWDDDIQETTLRAKLLGVIYFSEGAELNRATIRLIQENKSDVYREGDPLTQDVVVAKIEIKRVLLKRQDGQLEELSLEEQDMKASSSSKRRDDSRYIPRISKLPPEERSRALSEYRKALGIDNRIRKISDTEYSIERSAITDALSDLNTLFTQMRLVPNFVGEGDERTVDGFRVFRIKPNSIFQKLGVRNGDIILNINGVKMDNPEKGFELLQQLRYENNFSLLLRRNDEEMEINYGVTE